MPSPVTASPVLFEDRWLIVVNKPAGVLSHPNPKGEAGDRCAFEGSYDFDAKAFSSPAGKTWLIHRLDQDTSGVLLAAKDLKTADACRAAFEQDAVRKLYVTLAAGGGLKKSGVWLDHLTVKHERKRVRTEVIKGQRPNAESRYRLLGYSAQHRLSWIEIELITGKTHQIRVQCASRHLPIVGDDVYGDFELNRRLRKELGLKRLCLHARTLKLKHPVTGAELVIEAPLPDDMAAAEKWFS
jgi:RluA family pseudouridine synthase